MRWYAQARNHLSVLWNYRQFILSSIAAELISRFSRSRLGALWMVVHPLMQAIIFALVLSEVMAAKMSGMANNRFAYAIYLMSGMLGWSLFTEVVSRCLTLFIDNGNLLKKIAFPKLSLPLIVAGSALTNTNLLLFAILLVFGLLGHPLSIQLLWLPWLLGLALMLALGIGLILGILNVFMRDIGQVVPIILQLGFWFTPIVYSLDAIPRYLRHWLYLNPLLPVIQGLQNVMLHHQAPDVRALTLLTLMALLLFSLALWLLRRAGPELSDVL